VFTGCAPRRRATVTDYEFRFRSWQKILSARHIAETFVREHLGTGRSRVGFLHANRGRGSTALPGLDL